MRVVRPDNLETRRARAPDRGEMVRRLNLAFRAASLDVTRPGSVFHHVQGPDEETAAFVRQILHGMSHDLLKYVLSNFHATSVTILCGPAPFNLAARAGWRTASAPRGSRAPRGSSRGAHARRPARPAPLFSHSSSLGCPSPGGFGMGRAGAWYSRGSARGSALLRRRPASVLRAA